MAQQERRNTSIRRVAIALRRRKHALMVSPAPAEVLEQLRTVEHTMAKDAEGGCHLKKVPRAMCWHTTSPACEAATGAAEASMGVTMAGLEPVVRHLLQQHGYHIDGPEAVSSLPQANLDAVQCNGTVDERFLDVVRCNK